tara:strand:- start:789 stop:956 length:168 start_codon:yes stop_codon:yes gene_type:complete
VSKLKELIKQHKKIEIEIKKLIKTRLNDRASSSWTELRMLKKQKLALKDRINFLR